jgi:hypothetical protein
VIAAAGVAAAALAAAGCTGSGLFASAGDWSAYRATRVEPTLELRLTAAASYLKQRPDGAFRHEVRAWFERAEDLYYASKKGSRTGLRAYLDALPEGPHREEVEIRLVEYERPSDLDKAAAAAEARITGPGARARAAVRRELDDWLGRWLEPRSFVAPLVDARADLVIAWSLALPSPRCEMFDPPHGTTARRCVKLIELPYEVDGPHGPEAREATVELTLLEGADGIPREVDIAGPDLFVRLEETYRIKPIPPDDPALRKAAADRATALVKRVFDRVVSDAASCVAPAQRPAALRLACEGLQVEVFPTSTPGEDDLITVVPIARAAR